MGVFSRKLPDFFNFTKMAVFWVVAPCSVVEVYQRFTRSLLHPSSFIALMMEAARTFEMLVNFYQTTWCFNPEDSHLRSHRYENLKTYFFNFTTYWSSITPILHEA
jgi:hypothetical protein